jgi:hypothetical protein
MWGYGGKAISLSQRHWACVSREVFLDGSWPGTQLSVG